MTDLLTWKDVKDSLGDNCTVILGNGFSMSYCRKAFNQYEIMQHMPSLQRVSDVTDIEKCIEQTQAKVTNSIYPDSTVPKVIIDKWIKSL